MTSRVVDPTGYYKWLSTELRRVHDAVKIAREEVKKDDKVDTIRHIKLLSRRGKLVKQFCCKSRPLKPVRQRSLRSNVSSDRTLYRIS